VTERTAYQCDHCGRFYATRHGCGSHEHHCKKNPQRRPKRGEFCVPKEDDRRTWIPVDPVARAGYLYNGYEWLRITGPAESDWPAWPELALPPLEFTTPSGDIHTVPVTQAPAELREEFMRRLVQCAACGIWMPSSDMEHRAGLHFCDLRSCPGDISGEGAPSTTWTCDVCKTEHDLREFPAERRGSWQRCRACMGKQAELIPEEATV